MFAKIVLGCLGIGFIVALVFGALAVGGDGGKEWDHGGR